MNTQVMVVVVVMKLNRRFQGVVMAMMRVMGITMEMMEVEVMEMMVKVMGRVRVIMKVQPPVADQTVEGEQLE